MLSLLAVIGLGFLLGMRHATEPDHVIAVATIVTRHRDFGHAAWIGAFWGVGHTFTIFFVGGGIVLFRWAIPSRLGLAMEFSVGIMLIVLGVANLGGILKWFRNRRIPDDQRKLSSIPHPHQHRNLTSSSAGRHGLDGHTQEGMQDTLSWLDRNLGKIGIYQLARPLVIGVIHGLAGSAAVALLILASIHSPRWALLYLIVFGIGTIAGMILVTAAISFPFARGQKEPPEISWRLRTVSGFISLGFGLFLAYQIGFVQGLFTRHPFWSPR